MKKFENPSMTISAFITENIITTSGEVAKTRAVSAASVWLEESNVKAENVFDFTL